MRYQRITLILIVILLATLWTQRPRLRLCHTHRDNRPKRYIRAMLYGRGGTERCLEEVQIAPRCNHLHVDKIVFGHGVMLSGHSIISADHTQRWKDMNRPCLKEIVGINVSLGVHKNQWNYVLPKMSFLELYHVHTYYIWPHMFNLVETFHPQP